MTTDAFARFRKAFVPDAGARGPEPSWSAADTERLVGAPVPSFTRFVREVARSSYGGGALRFLLPSGAEPLTLAAWNSEKGWMAAWPARRRQLRVFAFDWLGRQLGFVAPGQASKNREPRVGMLDPASGELFELPSTFEELLERDLAHEGDEYLSTALYEEWLAGGGARPAYAQCVGYVQPLFLGGSDGVENLALTDLDVYVTLSGQLEAQTAGLPEGTPVDVKRR